MNKDIQYKWDSLERGVSVVGSAKQLGEQDT